MKTFIIVAALIAVAYANCVGRSNSGADSISEAKPDPQSNAPLVDKNSSQFPSVDNVESVVVIFKGKDTVDHEDNEVEDDDEFIIVKLEDTGNTLDHDRDGKEDDDKYEMEDDDKHEKEDDDKHEKDEDDQLEKGDNDRKEEDDKNEKESDSEDDDNSSEEENDLDDQGEYEKVFRFEDEDNAISRAGLGASSPSTDLELSAAASGQTSAEQAKLEQVVGNSNIPAAISPINELEAIGVSQGEGQNQIHTVDRSGAATTTLNTAINDNDELINEVLEASLTGSDESAASIQYSAHTSASGNGIVTAEGSTLNLVLS